MRHTKKDSRLRKQITRQRTCSLRNTRALLLDEQVTFEKKKKKEKKERRRINLLVKQIITFARMRDYLSREKRRKIKRMRKEGRGRAEERPEVE